MAVNLESLFREGLNLCREGAVERATECFQRILDADPGHERARYNFAWCLYLLERHEESAREFESLLSRCPGDADIYNNMARIHMRRGDIAATRTATEKALEADPDHADALCRMGILLGKHFGDIDGAIQHLARAVERNDRLGEAHQALAICYHHTGRYPEAIAELRRALQLDASNASVHNHLGIMYLKVGEDALAETHFRQALTIDPNANLRHKNLWDI